MTATSFSSVRSLFILRSLGRQLTQWRTRWTDDFLRVVESELMAILRVEYSKRARKRHSCSRPSYVGVFTRALRCTGSSTCAYDFPRCLIPVNTIVSLSQKHFSGTSIVSKRDDESSPSRSRVFIEDIKSRRQLSLHAVNMRE